MSKEDKKRDELGKFKGNNSKPTIDIQLVKEEEQAINDNSDTNSIGNADDLLAECQPYKLDLNKLGWNLPTNDLKKSGQLDNLSVDSYWIEEEELNNIKNEKESHPANPNYKSVYEKVVEKSKSKQQQQQKNPQTTQQEKKSNL
jgi:hypothetical protein